MHLTKDEIKNIQRTLKATGFDPRPIAGVWGLKTEAAYQRSQKQHERAQPSGSYKPGTFDSRSEANIITLLPTFNIQVARRGGGAAPGVIRLRSRRSGPAHRLSVSVAAFVAMMLLATTSFGQAFRGSVEFTAEERAAHQRHIGTITRVARRYLEDVWRDHIAFHRKHRVSKYYGDRSQLLNTRDKRIAALRQAGAPVSLVDQLQPTSCVGLSLAGLGAGVRAANDPVLDRAWQKIQAFTRANDQDGSAMIHALQKLGWRVVYWNPAPQNNAAWDAEERNWASKGWHAYRHSTVMNKGTYYYNKVDDRSLLVGFGTRVPREFTTADFFVAVAHTGYHVFLGFEGEVVEAHSTRRLDSINNLERNPFNPLGSGGAPRWSATEKYRSGLIALPPR